MNHNIKMAIAGGFDPLHEGHLDHISKAMDLCDILLVFLASDEQLVKKKGYVNIPFDGREEITGCIVSGLIRSGTRCEDFSILRSEDPDGTVTSLIKEECPDYLAKGGDRTPDNMPQVEIDACKEVGCTIIYGVGDLLNSSSNIKFSKEEV